MNAVAGDRILALRERSKEERRRRILDAAENLIRELGTVEFSMRDLAVRAHISHYTSYNLIGSKGTILYTLLHRSIDRVTNLAGQPDPDIDPIGYAFDMGDVAVRFYVSDPDFFRPLLRFLFGVSDPELRPAFMNKGVVHWHGVGHAIWQGGNLSLKLTPEDFASAINTYFSGALGLWSHDNIDEQAFFAHIRHSIAISLLACGNQAWEERLTAEIAAARKAITPLALGSR